MNRIEEIQREIESVRSELNESFYRTMNSRNTIERVRNWIN